MNETPPIQCSCGVTAFTDIRFVDARVMTLTCFHCRATMQISLRGVMASQGWINMEPEAHKAIQHEPEKSETGGYKYEAML